MKYLNQIILGCLLLSGFLLKDNIHISSNLISLFNSKESAQKIKIANELGYTKEMLVSVKGFDAKAKKELLDIAKEIKTLAGIDFVQVSLEPSAKVQNFYKNNYLLLNSFKNEVLSEKKIKEELQNLYEEQKSSVFYKAINKEDPLGLFALSLNTSKLKHKGKYLILDDYGYMLRVHTKVGPSDMAQAKVLYDECQKIFSKYEGVISFAPFYYTVENSGYIQNDVQVIILLSVVLLLIVYYFLLGNVSLLFETLTALFSSMIFASLVSTIVFDNFHILSLAFGMSITAVSIDYLLHYHLHGFYSTKSKIEKSVLLGFLTTLVAFSIFSFIPIALIAQISFFAVMSLSFAYVLFTFVFKHIKIKPYEKELKQDKYTYNKLPAWSIFLSAIILFIYSFNVMNIDKNIRNLDYQNLSLKKTEQIFKDANTQKFHPLIVEGGSKKVLLENVQKIKQQDPDSFSLASFIWDAEVCEDKKEILNNYDFKSLRKQVNEQANQIGFKNDYFKNAYSKTQDLPSCQFEELEIFKSYNLSITQDKENFYTMALVQNLQDTELNDFASSLNIQGMFAKIATKMYEDLLLYGVIVLAIILMLLLLSVKQNFLYALNYILFPVSLTLAIIASFVQINLMHLFALIILVAIGIDYGIYMSNTKQRQKTVLAIFYSLLSTFAGFGVLVASSVVALNSIGLVVSLGVSSIFILIKVMK